MKSSRMLAVAAFALFSSTSAMALRPPQTDTTRPTPAGSVIDVILNRDAAIDARHDEDRHDTAKAQAKREKKRAKELRKQQHEREKALREDERERAKDLREAERERAKDLREAAREREKDRREAERERAKASRERARDYDRD